MSVFIERLTALSKERGTTRKELCQHLGIGINQIKRWEDSGAIPSQWLLSAIADYFGVTVDYLLGSAETEEQNKKRSDLMNTRQEEPPEARETKKDQPSSEADELIEYLTELRNRPELRMFFSLAKGATKKDVEAAAAVIEVLRREEDKGNE